MTFTERELALMMVALDNTSHSIGQAADAAGNDELHTQAYDMNKLWDRIHEERLHLLREGREETV